MDQDTEIDLPLLPAYLKDSWGLREHRNKGPKRGLSVERIVDAAIDIAASEGLSAVSMSRIASELGASTMALYRYLASKEGLLHLMADAAYKSAPPQPESGEQWRAGLTRWAWANHAILRRHAWVLQIPISGPPMMPNEIRWLECGLQCLHGTGLAEAEKLSALILIGGFTRNEAAVFAQVQKAFMAAEAEKREPLASYGLLMRTVVDAERFPMLSAVIDAGVLERPGGPDDEFVFSLERVLDGIEALIRSKRPPGAAGSRPAE